MADRSALFANWQAESIFQDCYLTTKEQCEDIIRKNYQKILFLVIYCFHNYADTCTPAIKEEWLQVRADEKGNEGETHR